jgi:hypothetical protein
MDLIYSRAYRSIALLDSVLKPETHLPALEALYEWGKFKSVCRNLIESDKEVEVWLQAEHIISLLEMVACERWSTRAWVLQEAFSAGSKMVLLFQKSDNSPAISSSIMQSDISVSEIAINMDDFAFCVDWAKELFTQRAPQYARDVIPSVDDYTQRNKDHIFNIFNKLLVQFILPRPAEGISSRYQFGWPKRSCNAATALSFLRYRGNSVVSDRASIFANLCDYDYRLDMVEVCQRGYPLSASLVAMSILNGDYSLLIPEVYDQANKESDVEVRVSHGVPSPIVLTLIK